MTPCVIGKSLQSSSAKKISYTVDQSNSEGLVDNIEDYFLVLHFNVIANICRELKHVITCPDCAANVVVIDQHLKRMGFAHCILIKCSTYDWMKPFYTSPKTSYNPESDFKGCKAFDAVARALIGFWEIGCGFSSMQIFSSIMNLKSIASFSFKQLNKTLMTAYKNVAKCSINVLLKKLKK